MVVRYDRHGCGLSDRNRTDFSLESEVRTIEALVKKLELKSFVLWVQGSMGASAVISYGAKFPGRVSHLILSNAQARWHGAHPWRNVDQETLMLSNWRKASLAVAEGMLGGAFNDASVLKWCLRTREEG
jgi:pimeloyl-ACP methyl ester carboxylesterase